MDVQTAVNGLLGYLKHEDSQASSAASFVSGFYADFWIFIVDVDIRDGYILWKWKSH